MDDPYETVTGALPPDEWEAWHYIRDNLSDLHWFADQVNAACLLLDHCQEMVATAPDENAALRWSLWSYVPVRDAAINIYNFAQTKQAIHKLAGQSATIRTQIDQDKKAEAGRYIEEAVPKFGLVRQSIGHAGELLTTPAKRRENRFQNSPEVSTFIKGVVSGRRYTGTVSGKIVSYELTHEVCFALYCAATAMDDSFLPLAAFTQKRAREMRQGMPQQPHED